MMSKNYKPQGGVMKQFFVSISFSIVILFVIAVNLGMPVLADQPPVVREAEKAVRIQQILKKQEWNPQAELSHPEFCRPFFDALKIASPMIEYVEPTVRTEDVNHPALKPYHRCQGATYPGGPPDNAFDDINYLGHMRFKLYRIDLDNNPKNGIEDILYSELDWERRYTNQFPAYNIIDMNQCLFESAIPVGQDVQLSGAMLNNYSALVRYKSKYYVLDLHDLRASNEGKANYYMRLWNFRRNTKNANEMVMCSWSTFTR
jgi:hypothetical protein